MAARDEILREAQEIAAASKEKLLNVEGDREDEARRAGEAKALAASEAGDFRLWF